MPYRTMGWIHANIARIASGQSGQGTVEYVGLMLLLAALLTGVVVAAKGMKDGGGRHRRSPTSSRRRSRIGRQRK